MDWTTTEGTRFPLGASWVEKDAAWNFALYSEDAERVTLLLYAETDLVNPVFTYHFDYLRNKSGRIWHCRVPQALLFGARYYAYSVAGPGPQGGHLWHCFDPDKVLLDPYAKAVYFPPRLSIGLPRRVPAPTRARRPWGCSTAPTGRSTGATTDDPGISGTRSFTSCTSAGSRTTRTPA